MTNLASNFSKVKTSWYGDACGQNLVRFVLVKQHTLLQTWCCHVLDKHSLHVSLSFYVRFGFLVALHYFVQEACYNPVQLLTGLDNVWVFLVPPLP